MRSPATRRSYSSTSEGIFPWIFLSRPIQFRLSCSSSLRVITWCQMYLAALYSMEMSWYPTDGETFRAIRRTFSWMNLVTKLIAEMNSDRFR